VAEFCPKTLIVKEMQAVTTTLLTHDIHYSKEDLIIHAELITGLGMGDFVEILFAEKQKSILLKVTQLMTETSQFTLSMAQQIANLYEVTPVTLY
jgi:adenylate cyclase class IV